MRSPDLVEDLLEASKLLGDRHAHNRLARREFAGDAVLVGAGDALELEAEEVASADR